MGGARTCWGTRGAATHPHVGRLARDKVSFAMARRRRFFLDLRRGCLLSATPSQHDGLRPMPGIEQAWAPHVRGHRPVTPTNLRGWKRTRTALVCSWHVAGLCPLWEPWATPCIDGRLTFGFPLINGKKHEYCFQRHRRASNIPIVTSVRSGRRVPSVHELGIRIFLG